MLRGEIKKRGMASEGRPSLGIGWQKIRQLWAMRMWRVPGGHLIATFWLVLVSM